MVQDKISMSAAKLRHTTRTTITDVFQGSDLVDSVALLDLRPHPHAICCHPLKQKKGMITDEQWIDLSRRFVLTDFHGHAAMEQLQLMYWYYIDYVIHDPLYPLSQFVPQVCVRMGWYELDVWREFELFQQTENSAPRCGGIICNVEQTKVLLVQSHQSKRWFFPAGKKKPNESLKEAAEREVWEEVGFRQDSAETLEWTSDRMKMHFFVIYRHVSSTYPFESRARHEIRAIRWFSMKDLRRVMPRWCHSLIDQMQKQRCP